MREARSWFRVSHTAAPPACGDRGYSRRREPQGENLFHLVDGEVSKRRWEAPFSDWLTFPYRAYMLFPFGVNDEMNISMTPVTQPWGLFKFLQLSQPASQPSARAYDVAVSSPESLPFGKSF